MERKTVRVICPLQPIRVSLSGLEIYFFPWITNLPGNYNIYKNLITALQAFLFSESNLRASAQKHCWAVCRARSLIMRMSYHDMKKENLGKNYDWFASKNYPCSTSWSDYSHSIPLHKQSVIITAQRVAEKNPQIWVSSRPNLKNYQNSSGGYFSPCKQTLSICQSTPALWKLLCVSKIKKKRETHWLWHSDILMNETSHYLPLLFNLCSSPSLHSSSSFVILFLPSLNLSSHLPQRDVTGEGGSMGGSVCVCVGGGWSMNKSLPEEKRGEKGGMTYSTMSVTVVMCELEKCGASY